MHAKMVPVDGLPRLYETVLADHFAAHRQVALLAGPRQVGKTTVCRSLDAKARYLNMDDQDDRALILRGPKAVAAELGLEQLGREKPLVVFDELQKHGRWKSFLKGFFDGFGDRVRIAVTGSAKLDVYRRGGDSLMGGAARAAGRILARAASRRSTAASRLRGSKLCRRT